MNIEILKHIYFRLPVIVRLLLTVLLVMSFFGTIIHFVEPKQFPSIFLGVWWAFVTGATVGYGDVVPLTTAGRVLGILLILSGGGLLTFYITRVSATTIQYEQKLSKGKVSYRAKNHIVIVGWNERTRQMVRLVKKYHPKAEMVLIDDSLDRLPYKEFPVHFIHGDATEDHTLKLANITMAKSAVITADHTKQERESDNRTILTTVAIRGNHEQIPIVAEILSKNQFDNAVRAGASTLIRSNDFMSVLLYHELFNRKEAEPYDTILHMLSSQQFEQTTLPESLVDKSYQQTILLFFQQKKLALGVIRDDSWHINPDPEFKLQKNDIVILMSNEE